MNLFDDAFADVDEVEQVEELTVDQRLKVAEIKALLSISQALSRIHDERINPEYLTGS